MDYFIITQDKRYTDAPNIINWFDKIDVKNICPARSYYLPKRLLLEIRNNPEVVFTDIVSFPFFLVSDICKQMIQKYEPRTPFKQIVLMDMKTHKMSLYHLPILKKIDCLSTDSVLNQDKSVIEKMVLQKDRIEGLSIFQIDGVKSNYTVIRLDLLESILRRGAKGIAIEQVEVREMN